jgi:broad specificity phosphatase PhoE
MAIELVYETHAITTDNEADIATGWLPGRLSDAGRGTAAELGARRRNDGIDVVYVSDLERARETARIAFTGDPTPIIEDARLRECNYGLLNGMPRSRLEVERARHIDVPWPGGESYLDVERRMRDFLSELAVRRDVSRVLLISHSANRWALDHLLLGQDLPGLVSGDFVWKPGWEYVLPTGWGAP